MTASALPVLGASGYLLLLTLRSRRSVAPEYGPARTRFTVVVPAHNEASGITETVTNLLAVDYPRELFDVLVVADNCTDQTAALAESAGARVMRRTDSERRGKGYALAHAFERCTSDGKVDAVVVVDADTLVSPNILRAFDARIARGGDAIQADYAVRNPDASWRTRLMAIAFGMFHVVRSTGRESLGLSCGLRGNGMCFTVDVLKEVPHDAFSIVEDLEYGIRLGLRGYRVHYAREAHVYGEMVSGEKASRSQRDRWEGGRRRMVREHALGLIERAIASRDPVLLDLAIDLLIPPLSTLVAATAAGCTVSAVVAVAARRPNLALLLFATSGACLGAYGARGWQVSGTGIRGLVSLALAPIYIGWKVTLPFRRARTAKNEWVRTTRATEQRP